MKTQTVIVLLVTMICSAAVAQEQHSKPSLDELMTRFAQLESRYLPYHIRWTATFNMEPGASDELRRRYPWGDGRLHERHFEIAQADPLTWMKTESIAVDGEIQSTNKQVCTDEGIHHFCFPGGCSTDFAPHGDFPFRFCTAAPLLGIFPIRMTWPSNGVLLSKYYEEDKARLQLSWEGRDAVIAFEFGASETFRSRYKLWLDRDYDWHPVRMERYLDPDDGEFFEEWEATRFYHSSVGRQVRAGRVRYRDSENSEMAGGLGTSPETVEVPVPIYRTGPVGSTESRLPIAYAVAFKVSDTAYGGELEDGVFSVSAPQIGATDDTDSAGPISDDPAATAGTGNRSDADDLQPATAEEGAAESATSLFLSPAGTRVADTVEEYLRLELVKAELQEDTLKREYGPGHPQLADIEHRIELLRRKLTELQASKSSSGTTIGGGRTGSADSKSTSRIPAADRKQLQRQRESLEQAYRDAERASGAAAAAFQAEAQQKSPDPEALTKLRRELEAAVSRAFEAQSTLQQLRIQLAELDLQEVKAKRQQRLSVAGRIIERRVNDLLSGMDLSWETDSDKSIRGADADSQSGRQLLYFTASYCQPCQKMDPHVEELAQQFPQAVKIIDITQSPQLPRQYNVERIPTLIALQNDVEIARLAGVQPQEQLLSLLTMSAETPASQRLRFRPDAGTTPAGGVNQGKTPPPERSDPDRPR